MKLADLGLSRFRFVFFLLFYFFFSEEYLFIKHRLYRFNRNTTNLMQLERNPVSRQFSPKLALQWAEGSLTSLFLSEISKNKFEGDTNYQNTCCIQSCKLLQYSIHFVHNLDRQKDQEVVWDIISSQFTYIVTDKQESTLKMHSMEMSSNIFL